MRALKIPVRFTDWIQAVRYIANQLNYEPTFSVALLSGTAVTAVSNPLVGKDSVMAFMPTSATAAAEQSAMYVSAKGKGTFDITHTNNGLGDRTYDYSVFG
ncbi:hypothetical protein KAR91_11705 [Candidatus Pacearchaeota archaeon]|nr:hypothetical protein [Candidatus Pacearchaeota archaeon]